MSLDHCQSCFERKFNYCETGIQLSLGLDAGSYVAWLKDKFDNYYTQTVTVNSNGDTTLTMASFDVTVTPYSGKYELTFRESTAYDTDLELYIEGNTYQCILLSFYDKS